MPATVADHYRYVIGVDTHAATHSYAIVAASGGALLDQSTFPTTPAGLRRARDWIGRRTDGDLDGVLIAAEGTGSYGAILGDVLEDAGYRVVEAPTPRRERGRGKTDALDAVLAARSTLVLPLTMLRDRRAGQARTALQVLTVAREHLNVERVRCINALTALVRSHDLGVDSRKALSTHQISTIAGWRRREEPVGTATARAEAVRLAKRTLALDQDLADNRATLTELVTAEAPELLELHGVGAITAAIVLTVWSHPGRIRSEAAFAQIAGTAPIPASSGNTVRHRLNRGGDRQLNRALNTIVLTRIRTYAETRAYLDRRLAEGKTNKEIRRCLKRYVSRQIFRTLATAQPPQTVTPAA
ncbi:transposase IS116 [Knoellia subterranea KCTC 19937]|uniref:Transposase IS116 n=1 Tax=Knoellia subterranea KCTC 19937 TaxID=1385521 RepID=A0A0A0JP95_9MICO|nr:transposase IS116 [Knoellia subterranea KCTC 19937]